jgi:tetraacyldisaccharide 4'-kinase
MTPERRFKKYRWLLPLSGLYGLAVELRNWLFDRGLLKQQSFSLPIINVGNITVGGTGKTPHVEYLVRLLSPLTQVAVLSRGYKRKTKGYRLATALSTASEVGDEPFQMSHKFPTVYVAVDADRPDGVRHLISDTPTADVGAIILDDAYQHRYIKPGLNILLTDFNRLFIYDSLLPAGRLRESAKGKDRADIVIVTKCPSDIDASTISLTAKALRLQPRQSLYFTTLRYGQPYRLFQDDGQPVSLPPLNAQTQPATMLADRHVLLVTGIASPKVMVRDLGNRCASLTPLTFADHHQFTTADAERINDTFAALKEPRLIITTEKDATRLLLTDGLSQDVRQHLYVQPIEVAFLNGQQESFNNKIISYVREN